MPDRDYLFYELTNSVCSTCLRKVEAKILIQDNRVYLQKWCPTHKLERVLISTDADYYKLQRNYLKPGQMPVKFNTPIKYGCPYDCGLCPDHEQHSCLTLVEVTDQCNLECPVCYSESSPRRTGTHRPLSQIEFMLDCVVRNEREPDVVQISGGEPTIHPDFFAILDAAKRRPIKHLMVNTNGVRIATDPTFAARLATYMPGFELYLQWDSFEERALMDLRGADLRDVRMNAIARLNEHNVSTTLVVTLKKGVNDHEIGRIIDFALQQPCVRGVTFQPVQHAGRTDHFDPSTDRLTLSEVRQSILDQHPLFKPEDIIPVPCHPDCLAMAYALKVPSCSPTPFSDGAECSGTPRSADRRSAAPDSSFRNPQSAIRNDVLPLTRMIPPEVLLQSEGSTIVYERHPDLRTQLFKAFSTNHSPATAATSLKQLLCCLPLADVPDEITYRNVFRIIIMKFMDAHDLDIRSVKKTCVHIVHPDGRIIPFDTYNLFYRDARESTLPRHDLTALTVNGK